jgi:hypothetical protein
MEQYNSRPTMCLYLLMASNERVRSNTKTSEKQQFVGYHISRCHWSDAAARGYSARRFSP